MKRTDDTNVTNEEPGKIDDTSTKHPNSVKATITLYADTSAGGSDTLYAPKSALTLDADGVSSGGRTLYPPISALTGYANSSGGAGGTVNPPISALTGYAGSCSATTLHADISARPKYASTSSLAVSVYADVSYGLAELAALTVHADVFARLGADAEISVRSTDHASRVVAITPHSVKNGGILHTAPSATPRSAPSASS